jgi:hypothetical protein
MQMCIDQAGDEPSIAMVDKLALRKGVEHGIAFSEQGNSARWVYRQRASLDDFQSVFSGKRIAPQMGDRAGVYRIGHRWRTDSLPRDVY